MRTTEAEATVPALAMGCGRNRPFSPRVHVQTDGLGFAGRREEPGKHFSPARDALLCSPPARRAPAVLSSPRSAGDPLAPGLLRRLPNGDQTWGRPQRAVGTATRPCQAGQERGVSVGGAWKEPRPWRQSKARAARSLLRPGPQWPRLFKY